MRDGETILIATNYKAAAKETALILIIDARHHTHTDTQTVLDSV